MGIKEGGMCKKAVVEKERRAVSLLGRRANTLHCVLVRLCFISFSPSPKWVPNLTTLPKVKICSASTCHTEAILLSKEVTRSLAYSHVELASLKFFLNATNSPFPKSSPNKPTNKLLLIHILRMSFLGQYSTARERGL